MSIFSSRSARKTPAKLGGTRCGPAPRGFASLRAHPSLRARHGHGAGSTKPAHGTHLSERCCSPSVRADSPPGILSGKRSAQSLGFRTANGLTPHNPGTPYGLGVCPSKVPTNISPGSGIRLSEPPREPVLQGVLAEPSPAPNMAPAERRQSSCPDIRWYCRRRRRSQQVRRRVGDRQLLGVQGSLPLRTGSTVGSPA